MRKKTMCPKINVGDCNSAIDIFLSVQIIEVLEFEISNTFQSKRSPVESTVSEYVSKSTIHGMAYVADDERHKSERLSIG